MGASASLTLPDQPEKAACITGVIMLDFRQPQEVGMAIRCGSVLRGMTVLAGLAGTLAAFPAAGVYEKR